MQLATSSPTDQVLI